MTTTTTTTKAPTATTTTTTKAPKAAKRHGSATRKVLAVHFTAMSASTNKIDMTLANVAAKALTIKPAGMTALGRKGNAKFDAYQPVSGIIDNWLVSQLSKKAVVQADIEALCDTIAKAENFTSKLKPASKQGSKAESLHASIATLTHVINCFQAMRLESVNNSVKKLKAIGYGAEKTTAIILGLNQIAFTLRPDFMAVKGRMVKAYKAL